MADAYAAALADLLDDAEDPEEARVPWEKSARPEQLPPPGDWFVWLILAGVAASTVSGALEAFVRAAAIELPNSPCLNRLISAGAAG